MFNKDIIIGQYIPGKSLLHKLNPALKIVFVILYIFLLFYIDKPISYAVFTMFTAAVVFISKISLCIILKGIKPMLWILIFTAVLNLFMTPGETLASVPIFGAHITIAREGVVLSIKTSIRLLYLLAGTELLTLTTPPLLLTDGIETLLKPLTVIKIPAHEIAMMMTIAIRFIPTLAEEAEKIMKAQTARGADFETGNIIHRAKALVPLLVPLFISAFRRADELATAMDARCYGCGIKRTRMKEIHITSFDLAGTAVFAAASTALILAELL